MTALVRATSEADGVLVTARDRADAIACRGHIRRHSRSFYLSSLLLPARVRTPAWALYAFCRRADDAVDEAGEGDGEGERALLGRIASLRARLDRAHADPAQALEGPDPIDRAYARVAARFDIPYGVPDALLAGMEMDARGTRYATWDELLAYCFRVAGTVGLMMAAVMGAERDDALLRAVDLGVAMQLTNIARDVGEDARRGRVYLPDELLHAHGMDRDAVIRMQSVTDGMRNVINELLARADAHYAAARHGIALLPRDCRVAISAAGRIYRAIGADLAAHGHDSITRRAHTSGVGKLLLVARALPDAFVRPRAPIAGPADRVLAPLVEAAMAGRARS